MPAAHSVIINLKFTKTKQALSPIIQKSSTMSMEFVKIKSFFWKMINIAANL